MPTVTLARNAMATRFEVVLQGDNPRALRAAGEEALDEVDRLEAQLSLYRPNSEIARLNAHAADHPVRVEPSLFRLLTWARQLSNETGGAFDITVAPLLQCWGFLGGPGAPAKPATIEAARALVGMNLVEFDERTCSVRFARPGVTLDLGAIGKGYAVERATQILREAGVEHALLHGGTSTISAIGQPFDEAAWKVAIERPPVAEEVALPAGPVAVLSLKDEALSVSSVWGKAFQAEGKVYGHVIDPRTGWPTQAAALAAVVLPSATESDALSTALLNLGPEGLGRLTQARPSARALVLSLAPGGLRLRCVTKACVCAEAWAKEGALPT